MQNANLIKSGKTTTIIRWVVVLVGLALFLAVGIGGFFLIRDGNLALWLLFVVSIAWSVGSLFLLYYVMQRLTDLLPLNLARIITPFIFIAPVVILVGWGLAVPLVRTVIDSFFQFNAIGEITDFVFLDNYAKVFTDSDSLTTLRNNALWIIVGTPVALTLGMLVAVLADGRRFERFTKTIIFMPMAISLVGAGIIWSIVYQFQAEGFTQTGLLNAVVVGLGGTPQSWIFGLTTWNNFFLVIISLWSGTGFAMVFFSAALRGVPRELIEAAQVDGANGIRIFFSIRLPYIWPAILAVGSTSIIFNLKIFDIVQVLTGGGFQTEVLATAFFRSQYEVFDFGLAATYAVVLLVLVIPVMIYNLRQFRANEGINPGGETMLRRIKNKFFRNSQIKSYSEAGK